MSSSIDVQALGATLRELAREEILSRFRVLTADEISRKPSEADPDDLVTAADLAVERRLTPILRTLLPGSVVVGEEAAAATPTLLDAVGGRDPVWVLDPLDGTKNFAAGAPHFGTMLALLRGSEIVAAWIHLPVDDVLYLAEARAGATRNGERMWTAGATRSISADAPARGTLYTRHMPADERARVEAAVSAAGADLKVSGSPGSAALEYVALAERTKDFVLYHRLLPWDHAPGALLVREAGGVVRHRDGRDYTPTTFRATTLAAGTPALGDDVGARLFGI